MIFEIYAYQSDLKHSLISTLKSDKTVYLLDKFKNISEITNFIEYYNNDADILKSTKNKKKVAMLVPIDSLDGRQTAEWFVNHILRDENFDVNKDIVNFKFHVEPIDNMVNKEYGSKIENIITEFEQFLDEQGLVEHEENIDTNKKSNNRHNNAISERIHFLNRLIDSFGNLTESINIVYSSANEENKLPLTDEVIEDYNATLCNLMREINKTIDLI